MSGLTVKPVTSRADQRRFVDFAWSLYRDDPNWVPPLVDNQRQLLGYKPHPFYDEAEAQTFLAWRDGLVCGRVSAIVNHAYNRRYQEKLGYFGFFESVEDQAVAQALFDAARDWFAGHGIRAVRGPANPSMNYECGLLVDGFDSPPTFMMTYNPPYYGRLIEGVGFQKVHDLYAYIGYLDQLPAVTSKLERLAEQVKERFSVVVRGLNPKRFMQDVEMFLEQYNFAMQKLWAFVPLREGEMRHLAHSFKYLIVPEMAVAAEIDGRPVGAILCLPDFNPLVKKINGRLLPFGFIRLLWGKRKLTRVRVLSINVLPDFQMAGVGMLLMQALVPKGLELGVKEAEFSWVLDNNQMARMGLEKGGAKIYKTYRMYDLEPEAAKDPQAERG